MRMLMHPQHVPGQQTGQGGRLSADQLPHQPPLRDWSLRMSKQMWPLL